MSNNTFNTLHVDTTGWNGQLSMLDLYYLVKRLTENGPALTLSQVANIAMMLNTHAFIRLLNFSQEQFDLHFALCLQDVKVPFLQHMSKSLQAYWKIMWPVLCFSSQQAIALPNGVHAEFAKYGIDAITIRTDMHSHEVYKELFLFTCAKVCGVNVTAPTNQCTCCYLKLTGLSKMI